MITQTIPIPFGVARLASGCAEGIAGRVLLDQGSRVRLLLKCVHHRPLPGLLVTLADRNFAIHPRAVSVRSLIRSSVRPCGDVRARTRVLGMTLRVLAPSFRRLRQTKGVGGGMRPSAIASATGGGPHKI